MDAFETSLTADGIRFICGVDEVGRGPLAGPVVAGAVILNPADPIDGIDDSKKLSAKARERLASLRHLELDQRAYNRRSMGRCVDRRRGMHLCTRERRLGLRTRCLGLRIWSACFGNRGFTR